MGNNQKPPESLSEITSLEPIENLVFAGGGVKGIAYVGVLEELENHDLIQGLKRVGGSSAGGIVALLVGLGFSVGEIKKMMYETNFREVADTGKKLWALESQVH